MRPCRFDFTDYGAKANRPDWDGLTVAGLVAERDCVVGLLHPAGTPLKMFAADVPILDPYGLVLHKARTNLFLRTEQMGGAYQPPWVAFNTNVSDDAAAAPDGVVDADKVYDDLSAAAVHRHAQNITCANLTKYVFSLFARAAEYFDFGIRYADAAGDRALIDLAGVVATLVSGDSADLESVVDSWYRAWLAFTTGAADAGPKQAQIYLKQMTGYDGDGVSGLYFSGVQFESAMFPGPYIPTVGSTASSVAPVCYLNRADVLHRVQRGRVYVDMVVALDRVDDTTIPLVCPCSSDGKEYLDVKLFSEGVPVYRLDVGDVHSTATFSVTAGDRLRVRAIAYPDGTVKMFVKNLTTDTVEVDETVTGCTWPSQKSFSKVYLGCLHDESGQTFMHVEKVEFR